jgi:Polysaccharide deacetylase
MVTFVFDDGNDTDYLVARKIFRDRGAVACSAVTTGFINTKDHLTPAQIVALHDAGWEIMSHTVTHPNLRSLSPEETDRELSRSKAALEALGISVRNLVYPYNKSNETVRAIAGRYYRSGRGGANAVNTRETDPYYLKSYAIKHDLPRMERAIDRAHDGGAWIIFYQHEVDMKVSLDGRRGKFIPGETLRFSPSGAIGRCESPSWYQFFGSLYFVPLAGTPKPGDSIAGETSGAAARLDRFLYDERAQLEDMITYVRTRYPDMRIVTVDQGLDALGVPNGKPETPGPAGQERVSNGE